MKTVDRSRNWRHWLQLWPAIVFLIFFIVSVAAGLGIRWWHIGLPASVPLVVGFLAVLGLAATAVYGYRTAPDVEKRSEPVALREEKDKRVDVLIRDGASGQVAVSVGAEDSFEGAEPAATGSVPPSSLPAEPGRRTRGADVPPPSGSPNGGPPKRFLQGRFPTRVRLKARVPLQVRIALESGPGASRELLKQVMVPPEGLDVLLVLHSPGFNPSPVQQTVSVPASSNSDWALFELEAAEPGVHTVEVTAYAGGSYLGALDLQATVDAEVTTGPSADHAAAVSDRRRDPGEVSLEIRYDASARVYRYQWHSKTEVLDEKTSNQLLRTPQEAVETLVAELNRLARGRIPWNASETEDWLKNEGIGLWDDFIPDELKKHFWERRDRITSLTILSSRLSPGDVVPWELLYPFSPANDEGFLVQQFPVARWSFGPAAVETLRIPRADFVLPDGGPTTATEEVAAIEKLFGSAATDQPIRSLTDLLRTFDEAEFSLLHFACHNSFAVTAADKSEVLMGGRPFRPAFLNKHAERFKLEPLVFMNACRTDGKAPRYTRLDGWAPAFLGAGAGAFIGSLWEVVDGTSSRFAQKFYSTLLKGGTLGEALRDAREEIHDAPGDATWLAYTLYGNPAATLAD